ncbi:MAG: nuclear transport factor 2 family protein [Cellvibrionaceae bacterium]
MNRADHLHTVLNIIDTVFILKCVFIMAGLMITIATGLLLALQIGYSLNPFNNPDWLKYSQFLSLLIFINSWIIFFFLYYGRKGKRTLMRTVPPIGYTNIGLIALAMLLMVKKPFGEELFSILWYSLLFITIANIINIIIKLKKSRIITAMKPKYFADKYFQLLNEEKMTDLLKLFDDKAEFHDPFATKPVIGILAIEKFFQKLGDQFDSIKIHPKSVSGSPEKILINWEAKGITANGEEMKSLNGTNEMTRKNGKIVKVIIDFNLNDLPKVQLVSI